MESSTFPSPSRNFYSRPCGRGDLEQEGVTMEMKIISTHAPAGGATDSGVTAQLVGNISTHAPAGGATIARLEKKSLPSDFYSRPCGRGDEGTMANNGAISKFLLTPLREGRRSVSATLDGKTSISTHAPAGGAT